ncbi:hypothetical protein M0804_015329 [Polistes exclamans]|nr:hypothetical protein M0804_015329 [Polistes exclamans]
MPDLRGGIMKAEANWANTLNFNLFNHIGKPTQYSNRLAATLVSGEWTRSTNTNTVGRCAAWIRSTLKQACDMVMVAEKKTAVTAASRRRTRSRRRDGLYQEEVWRRYELRRKTKKELARAIRKAKASALCDFIRTIEEDL